LQKIIEIDKRKWLRSSTG